MIDISITRAEHIYCAPHSGARVASDFNAVYGEAAPNGIALPELLGEDNVMAGFRGAAPERLADSLK